MPSNFLQEVCHVCFGLFALVGLSFFHFFFKCEGDHSCNGNVRCGHQAFDTLHQIFIFMTQ